MRYWGLKLCGLDKETSLNIEWSWLWNFIVYDWKVSRKFWV